MPPARFDRTCLGTGELPRSATGTHPRTSGRVMRDVFLERRTGRRHGIAVTRSRTLHLARSMLHAAPCTLHAAHCTVPDLRAVSLAALLLVFPAALAVAQDGGLKAAPGPTPDAASIRITSPLGRT